MGLECIFIAFSGRSFTSKIRDCGVRKGRVVLKSWRQVEAIAEDVIAGAIELRIPIVCSPRLLAALMGSLML